MQGVHAYCFCDGKLVIVYSDEKGYWTPPGGGIEEGESVEEAIMREVAEETNMRVLTQVPISLLTISESKKLIHQARVACIVEPVGPFVSDPDGEVTEIKLIDPLEVANYFDWGRGGVRQIERALEAYARMQKADGD